MTRKRDIHLPSRTPAYVSREVGAAELCISIQTWDDWVRGGVLPPPTMWLGKSRKTPRWRWKDVDAYLAGRPIDESPPPEDEPGADVPFFREVSHAPSKDRKRKPPAKRPPRSCGQENVFLLSGAPRNE